MTGIQNFNSVADTYTYELIYNPLQPGKFRGKIYFSNTKTGQFWYLLNLVAKPVASTVLKRLECMLGTDFKFSIPVENTSGELLGLKKDL